MLYCTPGEGRDPKDHFALCSLNRFEDWVALRKSLVCSKAMLLHGGRNVWGLSKDMVDINDDVYSEYTNFRCRWSYTVETLFVLGRSLRMMRLTRLTRQNNLEVYGR